MQYGTTLWQVADSKEQKVSFNIAITKAKKEFMALKESKIMPQDLRTWDIIPLINKAWVSSFDQINKNKNAIEDGTHSTVIFLLILIVV